MSPSTTDRPGLLQSFSRSQVASVVATGADFGLLFALTEFFGVWYVVATALGALLGGVTNFIMNRHWSFSATHDIWHKQAVRYTLVSGMSMVLNTAGTWALTEFLTIHYSVSVVTVSIIVGFLFNFPLMHRWVFK